MLTLEQNLSINKPFPTSLRVEETKSKSMTHTAAEGSVPTTLKNLSRLFGYVQLSNEKNKTTKSKEELIPEEMEINQKTEESVI